MHVYTISYKSGTLEVHPEPVGRPAQERAAVFVRRGWGRAWMVDRRWACAAGGGARAYGGSVEGEGEAVDGERWGWQGRWDVERESERRGLARSEGEGALYVL